MQSVVKKNLFLSFQAKCSQNDCHRTIGHTLGPNRNLFSLTSDSCGEVFGEVCDFQSTPSDVDYHLIQLVRRGEDDRLELFHWHHCSEEWVVLYLIEREAQHRGVKTQHSRTSFLPWITRSGPLGSAVPLETMLTRCISSSVN